MATLSSQMVLGPDGNLWFAEYGAIGLFNPSTPTQITSVPLPGGSHEAPFDVTAGPDGNIWYAAGVLNANESAYVSFAIGTVDTSLQTVNTSEIPVSNTESYGATAGPDGNLWFVVPGNNTVAGTLNQLDPATRTVTQTLAIPTTVVWSPIRSELPQVQTATCGLATPEERSVR